MAKDGFTVVRMDRPNTDLRPFWRRCADLMEVPAAAILQAKTISTYSSGIKVF
jgi:hypothetical protein